MLDLTQFNAFVSKVFQTVHLALSNPDAKKDILAAVATITAAVVAEGANPAADIAALDSLNTIVTNLDAAKKQVQG